MSAQIEFVAQMYVSEQLTRQLVNTTQDVAIRCVTVLAEKYNFNADEAIQMLGLLMIKLERKAPEKAKVTKTNKVIAPKSSFPLPYNGEFNDSFCYALRQNNGLYTQCTGTRKGENSFCKGCASQMQKIGAEMPEYGTIQQRMAVGIFDYVDPKGRKPISYVKIMKKYKINEEQVLAEAGKFNMNINPDHFVVPEESKRGRPKAEKAPKEKGAKGRPKKSKKVLMIEGEDEDLFAALVAEANEADEDIVISNKKKGKTDEEKEAERIQKEAEKAEKEAKRQAEKAEKEAKLAAEKAEKEAKLAAEKAAKEAKKAAEEAEKQAKKEAAELAKKEKEAKLSAEKAAKEAKLAEKKKTTKKADEPEEEPDVVKKIEFEGKKYLKSKKTGIVYDYNSYVNEGEQVVIGKWNDSANRIDFEDDEESEEEYDM